MTTIDKPFIVVGGGIGGIATAIALSDKGYPVHVIEQAPEFAEIGAGIQLGPNIVRALDRLGIKQAGDGYLLAARCARDALRARRPRHHARAGQGDLPQALPGELCGRASRRPARLHAAQGGKEPARQAREEPRGHGLRGQGRPRRRPLQGRPQRRGRRADRLRRAVVAHPPVDRRRRQAGRVRPHRVPRRAEARGGAGRPVGAGRRAVGGAEDASRALSAAARRTLQSRRRVPFRPLRGRLERRGELQRDDEALPAASGRRC